MIFRNYSSILYAIGLVLVLLYLLMGFDDFIWDLVTLTQRPRYRKLKLDFRKLDAIPPKLLAVTVAAWHESNVLGDVIDNIIASTDYPRSMYHIFLGVYPNDAETIAVAQDLSSRHDNVHVVMNDLPGPTSKAQNINHVIRQIRVFEQAHGWKFAALTIHDSEDVVHPFELKAANYLLDTHDALQFPVFPLMEYPRFRNYFKNITEGTYADEFAENHYTTMVSRYISGGFVPSAGTGFTLSRKAIESFGDEDVLPNGSFTEDYRLSLTLFQRGIPLYYVLERVPRINSSGKLVWDYLTTRSLFPNTFRTAVKQKTRWIFGITLQSFVLRDIFRFRGLSFAGRYSLYKDIKAKVGNLLSMVGYPVLIYFFVSLFLPLQPIYPYGSLSWDLSFIVTAMMLERQFFRGVAVFHVYGLRSVFFACLFPPLFPFRLIWGNIINLTATIRAYRQKFTLRRPVSDRKPNMREKAGRKKQKQVAWAKTDHEFLEQSVLQRYKRTLGDILLERGIIEPKILAQSLREAAKSKQMIGAYLCQRNLLSEQALLNALSNVKHIQCVAPLCLDDYDLKRFSERFDETLLRRMLVLPLMSVKGGFLFCFCDDSPIRAQTILRKTYSITVKAAFLSKSAILHGLDIMYGKTPGRQTADTLVSRLYQEGKIHYEQVILARNYAYTTGKPESEILLQMGLIVLQELKTGLLFSNSVVNT